MTQSNDADSVVTTAVGQEMLRRPSRARLSGAPALVLLASLIVSLLAGSSAPTPMYALYQQRWGFSPITITVVFGVYALSVLAALLTLGKLSDHLGRRPILLVALLIQMVTMVVFVDAGGVSTLITARVLQGLSTGAALGAIGAAMVDVEARRGTLANALSPGSGTALGALLSGLAVRYLPSPTHLIYLVLLAVFALQAAGVAALPETVSRKPGALASLKPEITMPRAARAAILTAMPVIFAVWALAGLYGALGPSLVSSLTGSHSVILGGLSLFVLAGVAVIAVFVLRTTAPRTVMLIGIGALIVGIIITVVSLSPRSTAGFFIGTAISGVGFGSGFQGGIRTVLPLARAHERSGVLSLLYVVSYLGLGLPAVIAGFLIVYGGGLITTAREYGITLVILAALALIGLVRSEDGHAKA
ncbi:MFS transporter [Streptomyces sp. NPDC093228]|uniref:MFS transporter n=1 Tax=Streptomyces sp. NPDC093228 TaxID=3155070 RepID=UPI003435F9D2